MMILYLIGLLLRFGFWLLFLPIRLFLLPFRFLFGTPRPKEKRRPTYEDGLLEGLILGDLWDD